MNAKLKAIIITAALCLLLGGGFFAGFRVGYPAGHKSGSADLAAERSRADSLQRTIDRITNAGPGDLQRTLAYQRAIDELRDANTRIGDAVSGSGEGLSDILRILNELEHREGNAGERKESP